MSREIIHDLVGECFGYATDDSLLCSVMSFCLSVVSSLATVHDQADSQPGENNEALSLLEYLEQFAVQWLGQKHTFKRQTGLHQSLMVNHLSISCFFVYLFVCTFII